MEATCWSDELQKYLRNGAFLKNAYENLISFVKIRVHKMTIL